MTMQEKIVDLSEKWLRYVRQDHHKDGDCHWYIEADFAYGDEPIFTAMHFGYIADDLKSPSRTTYEEAEGDLLELLEEAVEKERDWVKQVLEAPKDWDKEQVERAELFKKLFLPVSTLTN